MNPHLYVSSPRNLCGSCGKSITHPLHQAELLEVPAGELVLTSPEYPSQVRRGSSADAGQFSLFGGSND